MNLRTPIPPNRLPRMASPQIRALVLPLGQTKQLIRLLDDSYQASTAHQPNTLMTYVGIVNGNNVSFVKVAQAPLCITGAPHQLVVGSFHSSGVVWLGTLDISANPGATKLVTTELVSMPPTETVPTPTTAA